MGRIRRVGLFLSLVLVLIVTIAAVPLQPSFSNEINGDHLVVGSIVARGIRGTNGGCDFGDIKVRTTAPAQGQTQWLGIVLDAQCRAVVNAKWVGAMENGPQSVIKPLLGLLPWQSPPVAQEVKLDQVNMQAVSTSSALATAYKTSEQHVYMYGYGGQGDKLTHKRGSLRFSYDGQSATMISYASVCYGSQPFPWYSWVVDACLITGVNFGPGSWVGGQSRGDYHCDPSWVPPCFTLGQAGYYHSLYDLEDGYPDGRSSCIFGWFGNIVFDVYHEILQGCS